ncbi:MAG: DUF3987 domain-containing protein [Oligoflexales bacterium]|nr:DUF3987 domain-containing protein [Oligoflexales bacterium]
MISINHDKNVIEILPLRRKPHAGDEYPIEWLGSLAPVVKDIVKSVQCSPAIAAQSVLASVSHAVQRFANISIDGRESPISLFLLTVAESGERKTTADKIAMSAQTEYQSEINLSYEDQLKLYNDDKETYEEERRKILKTNKGPEEKKKSLSQLKAPLLPMSPILLMQEPTYEGMIRHFSSGSPSLGICSNEGGRLFGGHAMNKENELKMITGLSELWDGSPITRVRVLDGASLLTGRRLSLHLMMQPIVASKVLSSPLLNGQGFLGRCLIAIPEPKAGSRSYHQFDIANSTVILDYKSRLHHILCLKANVETADARILKPRQMKLTEEAKVLWISFYNDTEGHQAAEGKFLSIKPFASKASEHSLRLAAVLALYENPHASEISCDEIRCGIELAKFYLHETLRIAETSQIDPQIILAEKLLSWIVKEKSSCVYLPRVYQHGPGELRTAAKAKEAIQILVDHGYLFQIPNGIEIEGQKRKHAWGVNPNVNLIS